VTPLSNEQIESIAARIAGMIDGKPIPVMAQVDAPTAVLGDGIFQDIDSAVNAAREAHLKLMDQTLAQRNAMI